MFKAVPGILAIPLLLSAASASQASGGDVHPDPAIAVSAIGLARPAKKAVAATAEYGLEIGGMTRRYLVRLPTAHDGKTSLPVVINLHGSGSDPAEELEVTGMDRAADREGFAVLAPYAAVEFAPGEFTWNVPVEPNLPDDVGFIAAMIEDAARRAPLETDRVYVTGFSGGGRLASELACRLPDRIAAVAAVGGLRSPAHCDDAPVPVIAFHGTADPVNPWAGGGPTYWDHSVDTATAAWVRRNRCRAQPTTIAVDNLVTKFDYHPCADGAAVVLYRIEGGGHTWPGSGYDFPESRFGRGTPELDATRLIVEFFLRLQGPGATAGMSVAP